VIRRLKDYAAFICAACVWLFGLPLVLGTHSTRGVDSAAAIVYAGLLGCIVCGAIWKGMRQ